MGCLGSAAGTLACSVLSLQFSCLRRGLKLFQLVWNSV